MNNLIEMVPEMVTIRDASERTGVSYYCLRKMCMCGQIVHIKTGKKYLINFGKLVDYLNSGDQEGGEDSDN